MKKYLKDVTLLAYSSHEVPQTIASLQKCQEGLDFAETKLLCHEKPDGLPENILYEFAPEINDIDDFNYYMFLELGKHVNTSHVLYVQAHAWILHPELWDNEWLQYDWIGSPWKVIPNAYLTDDGERIRNGNGGFSLRSKRLLDAPHILGLKLEERQGYFNEDGNLAVYHRAKLLEYGIKYAPVEVAARFAYENAVPENIGIPPFGYHRNLPPW